MGKKVTLILFTGTRATRVLFVCTLSLFHYIAKLSSWESPTIASKTLKILALLHMPVKAALVWVPELRVKIAIVGFLMFSCGSPVRAYWDEHKCDSILAVWGREYPAMTSQSSEKLNLQYSQPDRSTGMLLHIKSTYIPGILVYSTLF